jgi:hypothetical protein
MNCCKVARLVAQIALRMPISRVRSVTETSMMFKTPIPPTGKEIAATAAVNSVSRNRICLMTLMLDVRAWASKS